MRFMKTSVPGAYTIEPAPHRDERGHFMRAWCSREMLDAGIDFRPVQANMQFNPHKGTLRGLHLQVAPALEAKLVRCTRGAVFDVLVDLRPASGSYGKWFGTELSADNGRMLFVPENCAHGFQSLEDGSEVLYLTSAFYAPQACRGLRYDDPAVGIEWPLPVSLVSEQDRNWPLMEMAGAGRR